MCPNKQLLILEDQIFTNQKYTEKVKLKRSTKLIFLKFSCKKWNIFYNFKVKCRGLYLCVVNAFNGVHLVFTNSSS
jgi:hypothetical protein